MRIIAAEVCITPEGQPEVELGMLPLDVDLPGPWAGMLAKGPEGSLERRQALIQEYQRHRFEMSSERRQTLIQEIQRQAATDAVTSGSGCTVTARLTLHTSRGDLTIRQQVVLGEEEPEQPRAADPSDLPREQYRALLRSVERRPIAFMRRLCTSVRNSLMSRWPNPASRIDPGDDDLLSTVVGPPHVVAPATADRDVRPRLDPIGGPGTPLPLREAAEKGAGRILDFRVGELGQYDARLAWETNASMEVRISVFRARSTTPEKTIPVQSMPGRTQVLRLQDLEPRTSYRVIAESDDDRLERGFKTNEMWMR